MMAQPNLSTKTHDMESELADLLGELLDVQAELLSVLEEKRKQMARTDGVGIDALQQREEALHHRLEACHQRRSDLLDASRAEGKQSESLRELAEDLPASSRGALQEKIGEAATNMRLLQHQSLTNWVVAQRTLLHISQLLDIVATGGRIQPTYGKGDSHDSRGSLVDRAA